MKITTSQSVDFTPQELAKALAESSPEQFAAFWMSFHENTKDKDLMPFAEKMAQALGANRRKPLERLVQLISYVETDIEVQQRKGVKPDAND